MSSTIADPAKLKVVELRAELSKRGLDTKGNKPVLVKRLKEALEEELAADLPDTSIADTSTEDFDQSFLQESKEAAKPQETISQTEISVNETSDTTIQEHQTPIVTQPVEEPEEKQEFVPEPQDQEEFQPEPESEEPFEPVQPEPENRQDQPEIENIEEIQPENEEIAAEAEHKEEFQPEPEDTNQETPEENGEQDEPKSRKSRWGAEVDNDKPEEVEMAESVKSETESEARGEKRRRSSHSSPERSQRRRSKTPIKEDEPCIDNDKVQLSWYDSDLHLQLDKESFLSAKPYHEGAFGFAWAGVRATHGVATGKVCYEVKITEELKWEDFSQIDERTRHDSQKSDQKPQKEETTDGKSDTEEKKEQENNNESEKSEEKPEEESEKQESMEVEESESSSVTIATHLFRIGWSLHNTRLQLGEDKYSYGYESTGKFVTDKEFHDYGVKFGVGDVIATFLNIDEDGINITYSVNGEAQPEAVFVPKSDLPAENFAFFPHVLSRNYAFEFNMGSKDNPWFPIPEHLEEYEYLDKIESKIAGPVRPENRSDCEVILMCGLPASGKTHWVKEYIALNPDKQYTVIGNTHLLEKMTVSGDALKTKYKGRWNTLLDKLQKCLNKLIDVAALRRRNYIIDQTNVFPSAQRRKLRPFEGFKRRAVVVVVGDEEQAKRQSLQEAQDGKDVPDSAVLEMKANMSLPQKSDWIDEVVYADLNEAEAKAVIEKYNTEGKAAGYGVVQKRYTHRDDRHRWQNRRNDYRGGNYRDRKYQNNRYHDRGPPRHGNWQPNRPGGWNRDRRDNRGPPQRDWRNSRGGRDRNNSNNTNRDNQVSGYNRNRSHQSRPSGGSGNNWQSGNWNHSQGNWNNPAWGGNQGNWNAGSWNSSQNQWKYGGGANQGYAGFSNWNYYGQYAQQNWNQGQASSGSGASGTNTSQYSQFSQQQQQQAWAQYAQQYAQGQQNASASTPSIQK